MVAPIGAQAQRATKPYRVGVLAGATDENLQQSLIFFRLDHAANAEQEAGAKILPSQLILFGNPKGGAPLLQASSTLGIDLPNRVLIWQDASGKVWLTYNEIRTLFVRHGIKRTDDQIKAIEDRQKVLFDKAAE